MKRRLVPRCVAALSFALAFASAPALAAEVPDLVGVWKPVGDMPMAHWGEGNEHGLDPSSTASAKMIAAEWSIVVEAQDGRAFHGHALSPKGLKETLVGAIRRDNKTVVMSGDTASLHGLIEGNEMEVCFTDHVPQKAHALCFVVAKQ